MAFRLTSGLTALTLGLCLPAAGCEDADTPPPPPAPLTRAAVGHYCGMIVVDHDGPKAQILLRDRDQPIWFSSVRDAVAFTLLPDESKAIRAIYVTDIAVGPWDQPAPESWIRAGSARYVIGSDRMGGMGQAEAVPFSSEAAAEAFVAAHGGRIVTWDEIPRDYVLGTDDETANDEPGGDTHRGH